MRFAPIQILTNGNMAGSVNSIGVDLNQVALYSIQASWSGSTPVGTLTLEVSNDIVPVASSSSSPVGSDPAANVVNWSTYTGSSTSVNGNGNFLWNVTDVGYRWVRVKYTRVSGSGTINVTYSGKGV